MIYQTAAVSEAGHIGRKHRAAFHAEFGAWPIRDQIGDWDATGVVEMWRELEPDDSDGLELSDLYEACRVAYLDALYA